MCLSAIESHLNCLDLKPTVGENHCPKSDCFDFPFLMKISRVMFLFSLFFSERQSRNSPTGRGATAY